MRSTVIEIQLYTCRGRPQAPNPIQATLITYTKVTFGPNNFTPVRSFVSTPFVRLSDKVSVIHWSLTFPPSYYPFLPSPLLSLFLRQKYVYGVTPYTYLDSIWKTRPVSRGIRSLAASLYHSYFPELLPLIYPLISFSLFLFSAFNVLEIQFLYNLRLRHMKFCLLRNTSLYSLLGASIFLYFCFSSVDKHDANDGVPTRSAISCSSAVLVFL